MAGRVWRCGRFELALDRTLVMAIVNVTPDSFSDGGRFAGPDEAVAAGLLAVEEGAAIVDVGGESTRPGSPEIPPAEELARVRPVVRGLVARGAVVSVDTRHAEVAREAAADGAAVLNDVSGFRDPAMVEVAAACDAGCVVMHMLGEPGTMQQAPHYDDVVAEVRDYLLTQARVLEGAGVARERIAIDPGIGFGKTTAHNLELLRRVGEFADLGYALLVGVSRKRFIGEVTGVEVPAQRVDGSVAAAVWCAAHGTDVMRVHDVAPHVRALKMADALGR